MCWCSCSSKRRDVLWRIVDKWSHPACGRKAITRQSVVKRVPNQRTLRARRSKKKKIPPRIERLSFISHGRGTAENYVGESAFIRIGSHWVTVHEWKEQPIRNLRYLLRVSDARLHALRFAPLQVASDSCNLLPSTLVREQSASIDQWICFRHYELDDFTVKKRYVKTICFVAHVKVSALLIHKIGKVTNDVY